jgi:nucleotide-binding universal stress UspA family protein
MIKNILVCTNSLNSHDDTIQAAAKFSVKNNACLTGLYIKVDLINRYYTSEAISVELTNNILAEEKQYERHAKQRFDKITKNIGCDTAWHCIDEGAELIQLMFYTDVIFMSYLANKGGTRSGGPDFSGPGFINKLLLETGRPVVVIPEGWKADDFGHKILFGWNESRESARAMHEALPLMQQSEKVDIVTVNESKKDRGDLAQSMNISSFLASHNIKCQLHVDQTDKETPKIAEVILAQADENYSDLIVIGGYGHSHIREVLLGGVTRYLIKNTDIPLLLVH